MTLFQGKRLLLAACVLLGSTSWQTHAACPVPAAVRSVVAAPINGLKWVGKNPKHAAISALVIAFVHSLYVFNSRVPDRSPNRYDLSKLNLQLLKTNPQAFFENLNYLYEDGLIGHTYKSSSLKPDADGEIEIKGPKTIQNRGLYGWIHSRTKALMPTCMFGVRATVVACTVAFGWKFFTLFSKYLKDGYDPYTATIKALMDIKNDALRSTIVANVQLPNTVTFENVAKVAVSTANL